MGCDVKNTLLSLIWMLLSANAWTEMCDIRLWYAKVLWQAEWLIGWVQARLEAAWHEFVRFQALKYIQHLCTSSYRSESGVMIHWLKSKNKQETFLVQHFQHTELWPRLPVQVVLLVVLFYYRVFPLKKMLCKGLKKKKGCFFMEQRKYFLFSHIWRAVRDLSLQRREQWSLWTSESVRLRLILFYIM